MSLSWGCGVLVGGQQRALCLPRSISGSAAGGTRGWQRGFLHPEVRKAAQGCSSRGISDSKPAAWGGVCFWHQILFCCCPSEVPISPFSSSKRAPPPPPPAVPDPLWGHRLPWQGTSGAGEGQGLRDTRGLTQTLGGVPQGLFSGRGRLPAPPCARGKILLQGHSAEDTQVLGCSSPFISAGWSRLLSPSPRESGPGTRVRPCPPGRTRRAGKEGVSWLPHRATFSIPKPASPPSSSWGN